MSRPLEQESIHHGITWIIKLFHVPSFDRHDFAQNRNGGASLQDIGVHEDGFAPEVGRHGLVHDAVRLDEADAGFRKGGGVHFASARTRRGLLDLGHRQPVGVGRLLLLEGPFEGVQQIPWG